MQFFCTNEQVKEPFLKTGKVDNLFDKNHGEVDSLQYFELSFQVFSLLSKFGRYVT